MNRKTILLIMVSCVLTMAAYEIGTSQQSQGSPQVWIPKDSANSPIGVGKGIFPGRVVWCRDTSATPWDGITGHWWEDASTNQKVVDTMFSKDVCTLTGASTIKDAWSKLFTHYNAIRQRGSRGYRSDELIAVKINCNNAYEGYSDVDQQIDASKQTVLYVIDGLYGIRDVNDNVCKEFAAWNNLFHGEWLSSIFMSQDPVAIDAIGYDFLRAEFGNRLARGSGAPVDTYMHEAALADNPPSGTVYKPDGVRLSSLGVHEHWNNPVRKQYSRNLVPNGKGIELVPVR